MPFIPVRNPSRSGRRTQTLARRYPVTAKIAKEYEKDLRKTALKLDTTLADVVRQCIYYAIDHSSFKFWTSKLTPRKQVELSVQDLSAEISSTQASNYQISFHVGRVLQVLESHKYLDYDAVQDGRDSIKNSLTHN